MRHQGLAKRLDSPALEPLLCRVDLDSASDCAGWRAGVLAPGYSGCEIIDSTPNARTIRRTP
jgi:hypothetical protein